MFATATAAAACAVAFACGTVLELEPEDASAGDASPMEGESDAEGGTSVGKLTFSLEPSALDLLGEDPTPKSFKVVIGRPANDATNVSIGLSSVPGVVLAPLATTVAPGAGDATFTVAVNVTTPPQHASVSVQISTDQGTVTLPLTARVSRHLRDAGTFTFAFTADQTFDVKAWGAGGGDPLGGGGGYAAGRLLLPKGTPLWVTVGDTAMATAGGAPGGGTGCQSAGAGGGYSAIFFASNTFANAQLVAGAGGGGSGGTAIGGAGGSTIGAAQSGFGLEPGGGGGPAGGGNGGEGAVSGGPLKGGGGNPDEASGGGGGGAGYYGGGGGGFGSGGGGGSSFTPDGGTQMNGDYATPANGADPERMNAGDPAHAGAVLIVPR